MRTLVSELSFHVGADVTVSGWVHRIRDLGGVSFVLLRDRSGSAQLVFDAKPDVTLESVITVEGRAASNEKAPGGVEVRVQRIEVLSAELETAINAVSKSPAMTLVGLRAKLKLYNSFAEQGMMAGPLATMRRSMLDDLDRLLRQYVAKREFFGEEG